MDRNMYKSPIEIITSDFEYKMESEIFRAIQRYNINVDKEELLKALQYDRGQYEKGYQDGLRASVVRCKDCAVPHNEWTGCPKLGGLVTPPDFYCAFGKAVEE